MTDNDQSDNFKVIDLKEVFVQIWSKRKFLISIIVFSLALSSWYSLSLPNIYKSTSVLMTSISNDSLTKKLSSYSSIAGLAGIDLSSGNATKAQEGIRRIESLDFFQSSFLPFIKVEDLASVKKWEKDTNTLIYDNKLKSTHMSDQDLYQIYKNNLNIFEENQLTFIEISYTHQSPYLAKKWLDIIITNINESMRDEDKVAASNSIEFLTEYSKSTNLQPLKESISNLTEAQMQTLMLASSVDNYVFKIIDPPVVPEYKSGPNRLLIVFFVTTFAFIVAMMVIIIRYVIFKILN